MRHYILAKFQADAGDWHDYLPRIREIFGAAGEIPGVRGAAVYPGCVDRENRYHVLIELEMEPSALTTYDESAMHHRWNQYNKNCRFWSERWTLSHGRHHRRVC